MNSRLKRILSISLGPSTRDKTVEVEALGQRLLIDRRGTDGDLRRFASFLLQHDGVVDVLCIGGTNLGLHCGGDLYPYSWMSRLVNQLRQTPVVDGSGIKATLEPRTLELIHTQGLVDFGGARVLLSSSLDRFGMAEALDRMGAEVIYGDLMFGLGLPMPLRHLRSAKRLARLLLPLVTRLPAGMWGPGKAGRGAVRPHWEKLYAWAQVVAGDLAAFRPSLPDDLAGKLFVTNSTTEEDEAALAARGVRVLVTTSPLLEGRAFGTNVMEGVFLTLLDKPADQVTAQDYLGLAARLGWEPNIRQLQATPRVPEGDPGSPVLPGSE